jgi:hypothetical protein
MEQREVFPISYPAITGRWENGQIIRRPDLPGIILAADQVCIASPSRILRRLLSTELCVDSIPFEWLGRGENSPGSERLAVEPSTVER